MGKTYNVYIRYEKEVPELENPLNTRYLSEGLARHEWERKIYEPAALRAAEAFLKGRQGIRWLRGTTDALAVISGIKASDRDIHCYLNLYQRPDFIDPKSTHLTLS